MKGRGIVFLVALLVVAIGGALWFWKQRGGDKTATPAVPHGSGSAIAKPTQPAAVRSARITVTVRDETGPVAAAYVRIAPEDGEVIALETGADGTAIADKLAPGGYELSASATGHEPAALPRQELAAGDDAKLTIELKAGGRALTGVVTDVSGGPIAGARIDAAKLGAMARPTHAVATTITSADGKYSLAVAEGQLMVAARSPDYAAQSRIVDVGPSGATADFALVPGGVIEGIVVDEKTRAPIPNAIVHADRDTAAIMLAETGGSIAIAGPDGKFRLAGMRPGAYELGARSGSGDGRRSKAPTIVGLGIAEQVTDVEILVGKAPVVRGTIVDQANAPVANGRILVMGPGGGNDARADDKGAFVIEDIGPGKYTLFGSSPDHFGAQPVEIELKDKDLDGVVVKVNKGGKIVGRVEPPQICDVRLGDDEEADLGRGPRMQVMRMGQTVTTAADGKFEIGALEDDGKHVVEARCPSGDQGKATADVKAGAAEVVVKVTPGASIAGRVVDGEGKPVGGVSVMATPLEGGDRTVIVNGVVTSGVQALTSGNGTYEVRGLAAGAYRMSTLDRGRPMAMKKQPKVTLAASEKKTGVDLAVDRPNGVIKGVVTSADGKPLADAWVSVHQDLEAMMESMIGNRDESDPRTQRTMMMTVEANDDGGAGGASEFPPALTDAQGRFEIRGLPKAKYEVLAEAQAGKLRGRQSRVEPDAEVKLVAAGVTTLSGTVTGPGGPAALFTIDLVGPTRAQRSFTGGKFELGRVDPGSYVVKVTSSDGNAETKVEVKPGVPATVDIALVANAIVTGTIVDAGGKPLGGVPVTVVEDEGEGRLQIQLSGPPPTSGPDGKFRIEHKAGKGVVVVLGPKPITKRGIAMEAGKTVDVGSIEMTATPPPP